MVFNNFVSQKRSLVHFSGVLRPVNRLLETQYHAMTDFEFADIVLYPSYRQKLGSDRKTGKSTTRLSLQTIESRIHEATVTFSIEWFEAWAAVVKHFPDAKLVVAAAIDETITNINARRRNPPQGRNECCGKGRGRRGLWVKKKSRLTFAIGARSRSGIRNSYRSAACEKKTTTRGGRRHLPC